MGALNGWLRIRILERDKFTCVYCGRRPPEVALEVDHVLARSRGGTDDATNLVTACRACNNGKRAGTIALPEGVVPAPLLDKRARRLQHLEAIEREYGEARSVVQVIDAKRPGSLNSGSSSMDRPDPRILKAVCDLCGAKADTVHFVPYIIGCHDVLFACPPHDPGGYWLTTADFDDGPPDFRDPSRLYTSRSHILAKNDGWLALVLLLERLNGRRPYTGMTVNWREGDAIVRRWA